MKLTTQLNAWASQYYGDEKLGRLIGGNTECIQGLSFIELEYDWDGDGYVFVGPATITVDVADADTMVSSRVAALQAQKKRTVAKAGAEVTKIEREIQQLLAITMK